MAFEFGCFISYAHDEGDLIQTFVKDFVKGLKAHLVNIDDKQKYWWDEEQLSGGVRHPDKIATGMCQSACWVLIYFPKYRRHPACQQEYRAMYELEERRREALGRRLRKDQAMIIPILLGGDKEDLPQRLPDKVIIEDFSQYAVSGPRILRHPEFEKRMKLIAGRIWDVWRVCEDLKDEPSGCHEYSLPAPDKADWGPEVGGPEQEQPR